MSRKEKFGCRGMQKDRIRIHHLVQLSYAYLKSDRTVNCETFGEATETHVSVLQELPRTELVTLMGTQIKDILEQQEAVRVAIIP